MCLNIFCIHSCHMDICTNYIFDLSCADLITLIIITNTVLLIEKAANLLCYITATTLGMNGLHHTFIIILSSRTF